MSVYRRRPEVPDVVRVRRAGNGDPIPQHVVTWADLVRWYCIDASEHEARELLRRGWAYSLSRDELLGLVKHGMPSIRGRAIEIEEVDGA